MLHCTRKQYSNAGHFLSDVFPFIVFDSQHRIKFMSDIRTTFVWRPHGLVGANGSSANGSIVGPSCCSCTSKERLHYVEGGSIHSVWAACCCASSVIWANVPVKLFMSSRGSRPFPFKAHLWLSYIFQGPPNKKKSITRRIKWIAPYSTRCFRVSTTAFHYETKFIVFRVILYILPRRFGAFTRARYFKQSPILCHCIWGYVSWWIDVQIYIISF